MYRNLLVRLRGLPKPSSEDSTIAELRRILQRQQGELTELQAEVSRLRGTGDGPTNGRIAAAVRHERSPGPIDRRALLGKAAGVVAAGAGIALVGAQPAFAGSDGDVVLGSTNNVAGNAATQIFSSASFAFGGYNNSSSPGGIGVSGASLGGPGVMASSYD
jgi:hypothetical protein